MGINVTRKSVGEWIELTQNAQQQVKIPITLHTESASMEPFIKTRTDKVVVVPCRIGDVRVGDVILIRNAGSKAGVLLHRLYAVKDGKLITVGDNMDHTDRPHELTDLLGKAVTVKGPKKDIDCDSPVWRLFGKLTVKTYRLRPMIFLIRRVVLKLVRIVKPGS